MELSHLFHYISIGCFVISGISLVIAVLLFFRDNMISVINDLSGRTLRKNMERLSNLAGESSRERIEVEEEESGTASGTNSLSDKGKKTGLLRRKKAETAPTEHERPRDETETLELSRRDETETLELDAENVTELLDEEEESKHTGFTSLLDVTMTDADDLDNVSKDGGQQT